MLERARSMLRMVRGLARARPTGNRTIAHVFERHARSGRSDHTFLRYGDRNYTYGEANGHVNRYAHAYRALGLSPGDTIALMMDNRPEFLWHFLAAGKLGVTVGLINTHNAGEPLVHALRICEPKRIVIGSEHLVAFLDIRTELGLDVPVHVDPDSDTDAVPPTPDGVSSWADAATGMSEADPETTSRQSLSSLAAYIYTSGTTGLPKAAKMRHLRIYGIAVAMGGLAWRMQRDDVIYNPLPLYHTSGICVCASAVIANGSTMALARRFSASRFWSEYERHGCTGFVYIGELCRYLMNQPPRDDDASHGVRVAVGNGLRPDIWEQFQQRFGIERIGEFYGSTEGNVASINLDGAVGSVGRLIGSGALLVRWDEDNDDFARGADGLMIPCKPNEPGVLLGRIRGQASFDGYRDPSATKEKIIGDVRKKGDRYFNTGDMLRTDEKRRLFFVDRIGDTFRWKGENVSTFEVQEQLSSWAPIEEVNVYGVQVPHTEGRAGMASIVLRGEFDAADFQRHVDAVLPGYARPIFVRVRPAMETTGTLKLKKADLREEGFDPSLVNEPLYFRHPTQKAYVSLSADVFAAIGAGQLRL